MKLTLQDLSVRVADDLKCSKEMAEQIAYSFVEHIMDGVRDGDVVMLSGFGKFQKKHRHSRIGVDPRTKEKITIPEMFVGKFTFGERFQRKLKSEKGIVA